MPLPLQNNLNAVLGAAFLGVIGAAGMFLVEHYRQEKVRHSMAKDLARLDQELSQVRRELDQVLKKTSERSTRTKRSKPPSGKKANSIVSSSTADEYLSSANLDSSDLEFYDLSDNEYENKTVNLEDTLENIDIKLDTGILEELEEVLDRLTDLCIEHPQNPELLWRIGKAHKKISDTSDDKEFTKEHITKGIEACQAALQLNDGSSNIHKWFAILVGTRTEFVSIQEKINDGYLFKQHVEKALALNPSDGALHHMMGMFDFEVASMRWYERKIAATLFSEPPNATYAEALNHFLEAEKLSDFDWKANKLMIAKCKIAQSEYSEGVEWLEKAESCSPKDGLDEKEDSEIKALLAKYNSYR